MSRLHLGYLKVDLPLVQDVYFQPPIQCHCTAHDHQSPREYTWRAYAQLKKLSKKLKERFPDLILDLTFELWGAFHAIDYAMVEWADTTWASNLNDSAAVKSNAPLHAKRMIDCRAHLFPPVHFLPGSLRCDSFDYQESTNIALQAYPCMLGDLANLKDEQKRFIRQRF